MKNMKISIFIIALMFALTALTACTSTKGDGGDTNSSSETTESVLETATESTAPQSEVTSSEVTSSKAPSSEVTSSKAPESKATESKATSSKAPQSKPASPIKARAGYLTNVYDAAIEGIFGENTPRFMKEEDTASLKELTGIDFANEAVKDFIYAMPMMNVQFQYFIGIEANDDKIKDAQKMLTDYKDKILAEKEAFPYVDFGLEKARGAKVVTVDNYVFYVCLANTNIDVQDIDAQKLVDDEIAKASKIITDTLKN